MAKKETVSKKPGFSSGFLVVGVLLLIIGGLVFVYRYNKTHGAPALPTPEQTVTTDTDVPEESKPSANALAGYSVPAVQPRSIRINSIAVYGLIQKVGITKEDAMAVPSNIHFAGWYTGSVIPGDSGLSIINGHVLGRHSEAIFIQLAKVKTDDEINIEFGDHVIKKFKVVETVTLPAEISSARLFTQNSDIQAQLNLITCTGKFDKVSQTYADRVIVVAKLDN